MIIYLEHKEAHDHALIDRLCEEGHKVRTHCLASLDSDRSYWFRGTHKECLKHLEIDPDFNAIVQVTFENRSRLPVIDRIFWLDEQQESKR